MWIDALIQAGGQIVGQVSGSATEGGFKSQQARIFADSQTSQGLMQETALLGTGGWDVLGNIFGTGEALANQLGNKAQAQLAIERARVEAEAKQKTNLLIAVLAASAIVVIAIVLLNKR